MRWFAEIFFIRIRDLTIPMIDLSLKGNPTVLKSLVFTTILIFSVLASAKVNLNDCYLADNCIGNPNKPVASESAFNSANSNNIEGPFTQVAAHDTSSSPSSEASFSATSDDINKSSKAAISQEEQDDDVEK